MQTPGRSQAGSRAGSKAGRLAVLIAALAVVAGCSRGGSDEELTPPTGVPVNGAPTNGAPTNGAPVDPPPAQALLQRAFDRLAGESEVACEGPTGDRQSLRFAVNASGLQLGEARLPATAVDWLQLSAREGSSMEVLAVARDEAAEDIVTWRYTFAADGRLASVDTATLTCTATGDTTWPSLVSDPRSLIAGIVAPPPSMPSVDMDCSAFFGAPLSGPMRVDYAGHQLSFRSERDWGSYGPVPFWSEPPEEPPYLMGVELLATSEPGSIDLLRFFRARSPEWHETISVDPGDLGSMLAARVSARTVFINCERP
jgi:hypothetical protein